MVLFTKGSKGSDISRVHMHPPQPQTATKVSHQGKNGQREEEEEDKIA